MLNKRINTRICEKNYIEKVIDKSINKDNLLLANKTLTLQSINLDRKIYISRYKDLVYKLENGIYLTLSDIGNINKILVDYNLNHKFDIDQYERFLETDNVMTFAGEINLNKKQEDFIYLAYIQNLSEYGIDIQEISYQSLQNYLNSINNFIYQKTKKNIHNGTIAKEDILESVIIASNYDCVSILEDLNRDENHLELSKKYSYKIEH